MLRAANERIGDQITNEQNRAAHAMARLLDAAAVDEALDLAPGTVKSWMDCEDFFRKVVEERHMVVVNRTPDVDFGRLLNSKQRAAARMRSLDRLSQIEVARTLEVTDRTIRRPVAGIGHTFSVRFNLLGPVQPSSWVLFVVVKPDCDRCATVSFRPGGSRCTSETSRSCP